MSFSTIEPAELAKLLAAGKALDLIDVRTPVEYRGAHVAQARNVPLDTLDPQTLLAARSGAGCQPLYVICQKGGRSAMACQKLVAAGAQHIVNVAGGTDACVAAGLKINRGKEAISLERQVRIAAGTLVLVGSVLGYAVHPYWIGLSAFVGAGLVFAGLTDTCGMGMLIARMPWNKCDTSCCVTR